MVGSADRFAGSVRAGGVPIHYEVVGGGPAVLLLHGFTSNYRETWCDSGWVCDLVKAGWSPIGIDLRGHGLSGKPHSPAEYAPRTLVEDVLAVLDALKLRQVHAMGFSMGGGVLLNLARSDSGRLRRAVVAGVGDAAIRGGPDNGDLRAIAAAVDASDDQVVDHPLAGRVRRLASRPGNDPAALGAMLRAGGWPGYVVEPGPVSVPLLIGHAGRDEFMTSVGRLRRTLDGASWLEMPQASHTDLLHAPGFRSAVLRFLADEQSSKE